MAIYIVIEGLKKAQIIVGPRIFQRGVLEVEIFWLNGIINL